MRTGGGRKGWQALAAGAALALGGAALAAPDAEGRVAVIEAMLRAVRTQPESPARLGEEARLLHFLAEATDEGGARKRYRKEGLALAERALARAPEEPVVLLWWAAHRGAQASALNPVRAVRIANEVEAVLLRLLRVAPGFDSSAADRVLGHVYRVAPSVVSIGSKDRARWHLSQALERHPEHPGNLLSVAAFVLEEDEDCAQAQRLGEQVLASAALEDPLEGPLWRAEAQRLLQKATRECR